MTNRLHIYIFSMATFILLCGCTKTSAPDYRADVQKKPNILFILVDDMGWNDVGYNGSEIKTPNIDALAASGLRLDRAYAYPICSPTRAALMTGQNPIKFGVDGPMEVDAQLPANMTLLPEYLKEAGYKTLMVGKWHLGSPAGAMPHNRGFDYFYGQLGGFFDFYTRVYFGGLDWQRNGVSVREDGYATHLQTDDAVRLIGAHEGDAPLFMYLSYNSPHTPLQYPPNSPYDYAEIESPDRQVFAQMMTDLDTSIGRVVSALTDENMRENTLLVFMSDNGGNIHAGASNGELRGSKGTALEGGVRVPAFISWPAKIPAAQNISAPIFVQDWMPTLLEIAGAEPVEGLDGVSAWDRLLSKTEIPNREPVVLGTSKSRATYDWPMKLIRKTDGSEPDQLYNVVEDPFETQNLANKNEEMINRLGAYMENLPVKPFVKPKFPPPEALFRDAEGNFIYDIRMPETREPWAESATGANTP